MPSQTNTGRNSAGNLTAYALACGSVQESRDDGPNGLVTFWREHGAYHVRAAWAKAGRIWFVTHSLSKARAV
jgi:hypothetical protein